MSIQFESANADTSPIFWDLLIYGVKGAGKTTSALLTARGLVGDQKIALLNTERKGTRWARDKVDFDQFVVDPQEGYPLAVISQALNSAKAAGYKAFIVDAMTDFYEGPKGLLDVAKKAGGGRDRIPWNAWRPVADLCYALHEQVRQSEMHVIYTCHAREKNIQVGNEIVNVGLRPRLKDQLVEKFDLFIEIEEGTHAATISANRIGVPEWKGPLTEEFGKLLLGYGVSNRSGVALKREVIDAKGGVTLIIRKVVPLSDKVAVGGDGEIVELPPGEYPFLVGDRVRFPDAKATGEKGKLGGQLLPTFRAQQWEPVGGEE